MHCPHCQHENPDSARFCNSCGAKLEATCPQCSQVNPPGSRFCNGCGQQLIGAASPAPSAPAPGPGPRSYTPQHLAERIISSRGALEGERKQVTVLFADLKGSMELLADRDPEEARAILDPVLERMMEAVHHYEGTVNQVMGDGIMALFGAPLALEDHAVRACYAALRMQESVKEYAEAVRRAEGITPQIRVGVNSGEVVVRSIGSDLRMDYTAVGQTTHLAARMEQLATPGSILLAPETLNLAEGYVQVKTLGAMQVKGLGEPVEVYELVGVGSARSRFQVAAVRGLTRFVGRDAEIETLRRTLERAGAGQGQTVALVGEPGVGKSRLVWEFTRSHRTQGWLVLESGSVSYGKATSYLPAIDLLKSYCGVETRDDTQRIREKLTGKLLTLDRALEPDLPALLALLDVPAADPAWNALDPPQRRQRIHDALKRLILRESQRQPVVLVFEDLHWIDAETQALLDSLVESLPAARLLLLVNYRPEYEHHWHRKTYYQQLRLDPLAPESADELLRTLLGDDRTLTSLKRLLVERTEGNPFFLEESVRTLVETGVLTGEHGAYRLARPLDTTQVPATVQAVLAARLDRLGPEDKRLLQAAAVVGKDVPYAILQAIAELPDDTLHQGLARLQAAEFLYETNLFPDLEYTFKHALTHEVAYGSLLQERRRGLHGRVVQALETLYAERQAEQVALLGHHAFRGEVWNKAVGYLWQAGRRAEVRSSYREAVTYLEQALDALEHLPAAQEQREQAIDLRLALRNVLHALCEFDRVFECLREAECLAEAMDDHRRLGRVASALADYHRQIGDHRRGLECGERASAIAAALDDSPLAAATNMRLGQVYFALGDYASAARVLQANITSILDEQRHERSLTTGLTPVGSGAQLAMCLTEQGEFVAAVRTGEEAQRIAEADGAAWSVLASYWCLGHSYMARGDLDRALPLLERGLATLRAAPTPLWAPRVTGALGYAYVLAGRLGEGTPLLELAMQQADSIGLRHDQAARAAWLGEAYLVAGRLREARELADRALTLACQHAERANEVRALRLLGDVAVHADPPDAEQAKSYYRQALALTEDLGMRPLAAHCHLGLGTLYQKVGQREQAQAELTTAAELYRAMEMTFWLEKAEAALAMGGAA